MIEHSKDCMIWQTNNSASNGSGFPEPSSVACTCAVNNTDKNQMLIEIRGKRYNWQKEMAEIIEVAFLTSGNVDEFVIEANAALRKKFGFGMPFSLSLETIYSTLRNVWELSRLTKEE